MSGFSWVGIVCSLHVFCWLYPICFLKKSIPKESIHVCMPSGLLKAKEKEQLCFANCCFGLLAQNAVLPSHLGPLRGAMAELMFGSVHVFFFLKFVIFSPCALISFTLIPAFLPPVPTPSRGFRRLPKSRRWCVKS